MRLLLSRLIFTALLVVLASPGNSAFAWSMGGHRVTGVIAARELATTAPAVLETIAAIMRAHPAAADFDARMQESAGDRAAQLERLFAEMAQWPDEIRRGPFRQYHRGAWHTIEIPFFASGFKPAIEPVAESENLLWALKENARIAADPAATASDRAVALCWLFHLTGDLQQPLHAISLYSEMFPTGDRYGTLFWVRPAAGADPVSLHYFWDSAIQRSQNLLEVQRSATQLLATHPSGSVAELRERPYAGNASFERWAREESHVLAVTQGYRDGGLAGAADRKAAPHLNEEYVTNARAIAARRMALAGYRLAELLRALFP